MKRNQQTALTLALGSALAASLASAPTTAADNPFGSQSMGKGYMVAAAEGKCGGAKAKDGKCGEGKCGGAKNTDGKCGAKK